MIELCLITGFLGSGKTTLLKSLIRAYRDRRVVYLINEFSATDIDGEIVGAEGAETVSVQGGSIFCKCKVTDFIRHLQEIPARFGGGATPLAGVVIEASGIADPRVVRVMLRETRLDQVYDLVSVITVIDPGSFHKLLTILPNIRAQVESADIAVINKIDLCDQERVGAVRAKITALNPGIEILATSFAGVTPDIFKRRQVPDPDVKGEYAKCADPNFGKFEIPVGPDFRLGEFLDSVQPYLEDIYRIKGFVPDQGGIRYIDYSKAGWVISISDRKNRSNLVFIVKGEAFNRLKHLLTR